MCDHLDLYRFCSSNAKLCFSSMESTTELLYRDVAFSRPARILCKAEPAFSLWYLNGDEENMFSCRCDPLVINTEGLGCVTHGSCSKRVPNRPFSSASDPACDLGSVFDLLKLNLLQEPCSNKRHLTSVATVCNTSGKTMATTSSHATSSEKDDCKCCHEL